MKGGHETCSRPWFNSLAPHKHCHTLRTGTSNLWTQEWPLSIDPALSTTYSVWLINQRRKKLQKEKKQLHLQHVFTGDRKCHHSLSHYLSQCLTNFCQLRPHTTPFLPMMPFPTGCHLDSCHGPWVHDFTCGSSWISRARWKVMWPQVEKCWSQ